MKELLCFCVVTWRMWRVKLYIQHAGRVVFAILPAWVFFRKKFSSDEGCAESVG